MTDQADREKRWRLILGGGEADGIGLSLTGEDAAIERCLDLVYGGEGDDVATGGGRRGGMGASAPKVARWLGDIRS